MRGGMKTYNHQRLLGEVKGIVPSDIWELPRSKELQESMSFPSGHVSRYTPKSGG